MKYKGLYCVHYYIHIIPAEVLIAEFQSMAVSILWTLPATPVKNAQSRGTSATPLTIQQTLEAGLRALAIYSVFHWVMHTYTTSVEYGRDR